LQHRANVAVLGTRHQLLFEQSGIDLGKPCASEHQFTVIGAFGAAAPQLR
jgi:hypothetical protein